MKSKCIIFLWSLTKCLKNTLYKYIFKGSQINTFHWCNTDLRVWAKEARRFFSSCISSFPIRAQLASPTPSNLTLPLKQKHSVPLPPHAQGTDQIGLIHRAHRDQCYCPCPGKEHSLGCEPEPVGSLKALSVIRVESRRLLHWKTWELTENNDTSLIPEKRILCPK